MEEKKTRGKSLERNEKAEQRLSVYGQALLGCGKLEFTD